LEIEAMLPAPKAKAGEAKATRITSPTRRLWDLRVNMMAAHVFSGAGISQKVSCCCVTKTGMKRSPSELAEGNTVSSGG
jgi:hypothetical protein